MELYPSLLTRLETQHSVVRQLLEQTPPEIINTPADSGKWSIHDQVAHIARYQSVFTERVQSMLRFDTPAFDRYNAELDSEFETWRSMDLFMVLSQLDHDRSFLYQQITSLTAEDLARCGEHPRFGKMDIPLWTEFFLLHEAHHLYSIFQLARHV